ncbi:unnamed protein product [Urochloa humidicola]
MKWIIILYDKTCTILFSRNTSYSEAIFKCINVYRMMKVIGFIMMLDAGQLMGRSPDRLHKTIKQLWLSNDRSRKNFEARGVGNFHEFRKETRSCRGRQGENFSSVCQSFALANHVSIWSGIRM